MARRSAFTNSVFESRQNEAASFLDQAEIYDGNNRDIYIDVVADIYTTYREGYDRTDVYRTLINNNNRDGATLKNYEVGHRFVEGMPGKQEEKFFNGPIVNDDTFNAIAKKSLILFMKKIVKINI